MAYTENYNFSINAAILLTEKMKEVFPENPVKANEMYEDYTKYYSEYTKRKKLL